MSQDQWIERYFKITAIYAQDRVRKGKLPHPVAVKFCPVDINNYKSQFSAFEESNTLSEKEQYITKAVKFAKESLGEVNEYVEAPEDKAEEILIDSINSGWDDIASGKTVGVMFEVTLSKGIGGVAGLFIAADKTGFSLIPFVGIAAGATAGRSMTGGGFYFNGPREGLTGFGGDINASISVLGVGIEWEGMFTGNSTGNYLGRSTGLGFALSVEIQRGWTAAEKVL